MGNAIYGKVVCFDSIEKCQQSCNAWQCIKLDQCTNNTAEGYVCLPFDSRLLTLIMIGSFLTVLICCSSIVACYICKLLRDGIRQPICTTSEIVFNSHTPLRTYRNS